MQVVAAHFGVVRITQTLVLILAVPARAVSMSIGRDSTGCGGWNR
jgi:hypothetical protein